jgi:hypothetical protein
MPASLHDKVINSKLAGFKSTPHVYLFSAHTIFEIRFAFENQGRDRSLGERLGEGGSSEPATNDDNLIVQWHPPRRKWDQPRWHAITASAWICKVNDPFDDARLNLDQNRLPPPTSHAVICKIRVQ